MIIIVIIIIGASLSEPHQVGETFALYTHVQCIQCIQRLSPKGDLRLLEYCNYSLILSMIAKIDDPCFKNIQLKIKCYSIFQLHIL